MKEKADNAVYALGDIDNDTRQLYKGLASFQ